MAMSVGLHAKSRSIISGGGVEVWPFRAVADVMEVIPRTLVQNAGGDVVRVLAELRAKHAAGEEEEEGASSHKEATLLRLIRATEQYSVSVCHCSGERYTVADPIGSGERYAGKFNK